MLKWVFGADTSPFRSSLNEMRGEVKAFSSSVAGSLAGAFGIGAITSWVSSTIEAAGRINDLSARLDMSAESFQRLAYASKLSGGDMDTVGKALTVLTKNLEEAKNGSDIFSTAAGALTLDLSKLAGMSPEEQMLELSRGYAASADKGAALAAIVKLLGKSGAEIVPMLVEGPEALAKTMAEATIATNSQIAAMDNLGDTIDSLKNMSVSFLGKMIDGVKIWLAYIEFGLNKLTGNGDLANTQLDKRMDTIMHPESKSSDKRKAAAATEAAAKQLEIEKEKGKVQEDIAKLEEDARIRSLDLAEKILDTERRIADLDSQVASNDNGEVAALEARKKQLEIEKELSGYRKEQESVDKTLADDKQKSAEEIQKLIEKGAAIDRKNALADMSDEDKKKGLIEDRNKAMSDSVDLRLKGDTKGALEKENQTSELTGQIDDITRTIDAKKDLAPKIMSEDIRKAGGGGFGGIAGPQISSTDGRLDKVIDVLNRIEAKTTTPDRIGPEPY